VRISGLEDIIDYSSLVKIYPNPTTDLLNIETQSNDFAQTRLIDQNGRIVMTWEKLPNKINVSSLPVGNYYLQINTPQGKVNKKIIIIR
ncbi:MAG: T9SS type A sorting domain-containing protein, partial [Bacilli bacterium]|nr:T9SS type A sorting domain-containing protein [Bacilli bacterium]